MNSVIGCILLYLIVQRVVKFLSKSLQPASVNFQMETWRPNDFSNFIFLQLFFKQRFQFRRIQNTKMLSMYGTLKTCQSIVDSHLQNIEVIVQFLNILFTSIGLQYSLCQVELQSLLSVTKKIFVTVMKSKLSTGTLAYHVISLSTQLLRPNVSTNTYTPT